MCVCPFPVLLLPFINSVGEVRHSVWSTTVFIYFFFLLKSLDEKTLKDFCNQASAGKSPGAANPPRAPAAALHVPAPLCRRDSLMGCPTSSPLLLQLSSCQSVAHSLEHIRVLRASGHSLGNGVPASWGWAQTCRPPRVCHQPMAL